MATVVNARDVLLQAATPRVATVSMLPNLVLDQSQVTGLGLVINGTKIALLNASSQVFQVPKSGSVSPSTIVLTATLKNISTSPSLTVVSGTISPAPTLTLGQVSIGYADLITDTATVRLSVTEGGTTYTDDMTIVKVREGIDSITGFLTNENHTLVADSGGNVASYTGAGGTFKVFQGATDVTTLCVFTLAPSGNPSGLTYSINPSSGVYSVTGGYPAGTDTTTLTFRATLGSAIVEKVFTLSKSRQGVTGTRGSRTFYVALSGATATFSTTLADTTTNVDGGKVLNDTVTQYNNSVGFSETRFWNGSSWVVVNAVIDGNLLVSGSIGASKISVTDLSAINVNFSGNLNVKSATTGARIEMTNSYMKVFDAVTLRVQIGNLSL